jgi:hypothetical protein
MSNDNIPDEQNGSIDLITYIRQPDTPRIGTVRMLMRMALGAAIIGREELKNRFQDKQSNTHIPGAELNRVTPIESEADRTRYAAVGAVANSSEALRKRILKISRSSDRSYGRLTRAIEPVTDSWLLKPLRRRYQRYLDHGDKIVSTWVAAGRREEYLGRQLARETTTESIEEVLDYLADSPEMDELMAQQSFDLVDDILLDNVREGASNTSIVLSNWFNTVILRRKRQLPPSSSGEKSGSE